MSTSIAVGVDDLPCFPILLISVTMTGEPTRIPHKKENKWLGQTIFSFLPSIKQHCKQKTLQEASLKLIQSLQKLLLNGRPDYQLLKSEQLIFWYVPVTHRYTALQTNNSMRIILQSIHSL